MSDDDTEQEWFHIARSPGGKIFIHRIPAGADHGEVATRIRATLKFPSEWADMPGWDSGLAPGEPHQSLMDRRANDNIDTLPEVDDA